MATPAVPPPDGQGEKRRLYGLERSTGFCWGILTILCHVDVPRATSRLNLVAFGASGGLRCGGGGTRDEDVSQSAHHEVDLLGGNPKPRGEA